MTGVNDIPVPDSSGLRNFIFVLAAMVAGIFGLLLPWLFELRYPFWPWVLALLMVGWGIVAPSSIAGFYRVWMKFGLIMNRLTTPVLMGLLFFLVVTPTGWFMRLFKSGSMTMNIRESEDSYRVNSKPRSPGDMEKPF